MVSNRPDMSRLRPHNAQTVEYGMNRRMQGLGGYLPLTLPMHQRSAMKLNVIGRAKDWFWACRAPHGLIDAGMTSHITYLTQATRVSMVHAAILRECSINHRNSPATIGTLCNEAPIHILRVQIAHLL
jgi:hypothetical protein